MTMTGKAEFEKVIRYEPGTGKFIWLDGRRGRVIPGAEAGSLRPTGYITICLFGRDYLAHRLAWFFVHGAWPKEMIDHINGVRTDNRIENLREATAQQNQYNRNASGVTNFPGRKKPYASRICVDRKVIFLGYFKTEKEARNAYQQAKAVYHRF